MTWSINCDGTFLFLKSASAANVKTLHFWWNGPDFKSVLAINKEIHYYFRTTLSRPWNGFSFTHQGILPNKLISPTAQLPPPIIIRQKVLFLVPCPGHTGPLHGQTDRQTNLWHSIMVGVFFLSMKFATSLLALLAGGQYKQPYILHNLWHWS